MPLGKDSSSIFSRKFYDNSNVLLANLASAGTSSLDENVDETALLKSTMFPDSSDTSKVFSLLSLGDMIAKKYFYDECKYIFHCLIFEISIRGTPFR